MRYWIALRFRCPDFVSLRTTDFQGMDVAHRRCVGHKAMELLELMLTCACCRTISELAGCGQYFDAISGGGCPYVEGMPLVGEDRHHILAAWERALVEVGKRSSLAVGFRKLDKTGALLPTINNARAPTWICIEIKKELEKQDVRAKSALASRAAKTRILDDGTSATYKEHEAALAGLEGDRARRAAHKKSDDSVLSGTEVTWAQGADVPAKNLQAVRDIVRRVAADLALVPAPNEQDVYLLQTANKKRATATAYNAIFKIARDELGTGAFESHLASKRGKAHEGMAYKTQGCSRELWHWATTHRPEGGGNYSLEWGSFWS
eukprot:TRINITY_DN132_c2_g2_i3.p1 TRINITY_DN132_c2_g2~~TRINITY_DN132_c2_g2_i3.p1  ORF type:complete len:321 (-),score=81.17 TRINITY_DN132_c2_g2_i3:244-1206(-)